MNMSMFDWLEKRNQEMEDRGSWKKAQDGVQKVPVQAEKLSESVRHQLEKQFIAFDVETTGLDPFFDRIIELGAVRFAGGKEIDSFSLVVNAEKRSDPSAAKVHGISEEEIQAARKEAEAYRQLQAFMQDALEGNTILAAHNAPFDMTFLQSTLQRLQIPASLHYVDTLPASRKAFSNLSDYRQVTIAQALQIENEQAHRAENDARVCGKILCRILEKFHLNEQNQ